MYTLITDVKSSGGFDFNYAVMDVNTYKCDGFDSTNPLEVHIEFSIDRLLRGNGWIPTSYTELSAEFSTLSELRQELPELFI